jgi:hypothetical protein
MTRWRTHRLAPALGAAVLALNLAACDLAPDAARIFQRQAQIDPPRLWLAEAIGPSPPSFRAVQVCADRSLQDGFVRADPEVNNQPCRATSPVVSKPGLYAMRCEAVGETFAVTVTARGDLRRDFQVRYALTSLDTGREPFVQTMHYRLIGPCPAGWRIGDQGRPGHPRWIASAG